ncbi:ABC transporter permease subunit [Piscicoccus intestinalis]|uniref:ABC transporter permease subunit n=1 Tax=Piscicoccus intestinalis TaxID=746033 RepID=UPI000839456C|nr:ABC transporter permease subunit [Piscicoccus intestinalis]
MRKIVYYIATSVDGYIADSTGDTSAFPVNRETLDELFSRYPETCPQHLRDPLGVTGAPRRFDTVVLGRSTHAPALEAGLTSAYPHLRQLVVTRRDLPEDPTVEVLAGDLPAEVSRLKEEEGDDIWLCGGGDVAGQLHGPAFFTQITSNGMFVALTALTVQMPLFLPLAVAALSGDAIAGEAGGGTLRYVLTVPVGRTKLLLTKYLAALLGLLLGVAVIAVVGVVVGALLFGVGPVPTLSGTELGYAEGLGRVALAAGYATAALAAVLALGLLISTLTEQPIAAMIAVVVVTMTMQILTGLGQLAWLHPYLLVSHWTAFADLFRDPVFTDAMQRGLLVFACYVLGGLALAIWNFRRKDLTC